MKRYEKMSKEEIMEFFAKNAGNCDSCIVEKYCEHGDYTGLSCCESLEKYLSEELPKKTVSRWQTIKCDEDAKKIFEEFLRMCTKTSCNDCKYNNEHSSPDICLLQYLLDKIEVEMITSLVDRR